MKKVVIFQYRLLHYRLGLFEKLRAECARRGIAIELVHGQPTRREALKKDTGELHWAHPVRNRVWEVGNRDLIWQPFPRRLATADLVVVMQENRILSNYPLLLSRLWQERKLAYWGHGVNFQSSAPAGLREAWKKLMLTRVDWWFAYTEITAGIIRRAGFPAERITCLDNAIDNEAFQADLASISPERQNQLRSDIGAAPGDRIGLFCGSLYPDKRLDFMVAAADRIRVDCPDFRLVIVGDGPSRADMETAAQSRPWLSCVGVRKGADKAGFFRIADVIFNPGAVGLHVLDAFCAGVPMATTVEARHGPEIAYLEDGRNGIASSGDPAIFASRILQLLNDPMLDQRLRNGARESARRYTLENYVTRFATGLEQCLALPK